MSLTCSVLKESPSLTPPSVVWPKAPFMTPPWGERNPSSRQEMTKIWSYTSVCSRYHAKEEGLDGVEKDMNGIVFKATALLCIISPSPSNNLILYSLYSLGNRDSGRLSNSSSVASWQVAVFETRSIWLSATTLWACSKTGRVFWSIRELSWVGFSPRKESRGNSRHGTALSKNG